MSALTLLEGVRGLIERTYRLRTGLDELAPFVIGDLGLERLYRLEGEGWRRVVVGDAAEHAGARLLVRDAADGPRACVYFPDAMIRHLERHPPHRGLGDRNVDAFAAFVEEVDHLLLVADRARRRRPVTAFELELQANVSKYLVLARFLAGRRGALDERRRTWLLYQLFLKGRWAEDDPGARRRYRDAARWAWRLVERLGALDDARERLTLLRRFHRSGQGAKLRLIETGRAA